MGSPEGYELANQSINNAVKKGSWVLLKNVHLSPQWLQQLEKRLHRLSPHPSFRLFMTIELTPTCKVPTNLLRLSSILIFEPPVGVKASLRRMLHSIPAERMNKAPMERGRLYFLLSWLHAVVLERLRYTPVGWAKSFEFSETDANCAMDAIDEWVDKTAAGRMNLPANKIPWDALQVTLEQVIYGGRIDNQFDQDRLNAFVKALFTAHSFDHDFTLASSCTSNDEKEQTSSSSSGSKFHPLVNMPDTMTAEGFRAWVETLDDNNSPELLGLPATAEVLLLAEHAHHITQQLLSLQDATKDTDSSNEEGSSSSTGSDAASSSSSKASSNRRVSLSGDQGSTTARPSWMIKLEAQLLGWMNKLPTMQAFREKDLALKLSGKSVASAANPSASTSAASPTTTGTVNSAGAKELAQLFENPLFRCIQRECTIFSELLEVIRQDITSLLAVLNGSQKANNHIRSLIVALRKDSIPSGWIRAGFPVSMNISSWVDDLKRRLTQMSKLIGLRPAEYQSQTIWLGGLHSPEGFVSASRQAIAAAHQWPLDQLELNIQVSGNNVAAPTQDTFLFEGLTLHGANWTKENVLGVEDEKLSHTLPVVYFTWIRRSSDSSSGSSSNTTSTSTPVYLDTTRQSFLFSLRLPTPSFQTIPEHVWVQRGTSLTVWISSGNSTE
jgi:dynein heavy chain 1